MSVKLEQVFGVSIKQVLSYYERERVDGLFQTALKSDKQIIVYGSSKQGKTALVDKHLPYTENIIVRCTPQSTSLDIYRAVLRELGIDIETEKETASSSEIETKIGTKFKAFLPFVGSAEAKGEIDLSAGHDNKSKRTQIEFNLALPQDVSELIKRIKNNKHIVLENFHYLNDEIQRKLAFDLRTFQELGIRFIILGVWREKNRLTQFNGDLLDRIIEVPVEPWERIEFEKVIEKGSKVLNVNFSKGVIVEIVENAFDSIGVVQELLKSVCNLNGVLETQSVLKEITDTSTVKKAISQKADDYASRHVRALESIAEGRRSARIKGGVAPLYLPYYTVKAFLTFPFEAIVEGIKRSMLEDEIKRTHHRAEDVRPSDMSNLLHNFAQLQSEKGIVPPIFDYDQSTKMMRVVDSTFYFFLRNINRENVLDELINPTENPEEVQESV